METVEIQDEYAGEDCERCGAPMVIKWGRFGKFMACSNFPDCRNTKPILKEIGVTCPKCNQGQVVERRTKKDGFFMVVPAIQNVNLSPGINRCPDLVQNVTGC